MRRPRVRAVVILLLTATLVACTVAPAGAPQPTETPAPAPSLAWTTITEVAPGVRLGRLLSLAAAPDGSMWVGTNYNGVFHYVGGSWRQYTQAEGLAGDSVHSIQIAPDGSVWAATWDGVSRLEGERWRTYRIDPVFVGRNLHSLALGPEGQVWVGVGRGLLRLANETWEPALEGEIRRLAVLALWADPDGTLWLASGVRALVRIRDHEIEIIRRADWPRGMRVRALLRGPDGFLWMGTSHGLYRYAQDAWQSPREGLPMAYVTSLAIAPDGAVWLGTFRHGLVRYDGRSAHRYDMAHGLPSNHVVAVAVGLDGKVWAATAGGLAVGEAR